MGSGDDGGTVMGDTLSRIEVRATIPMKDGEVLTRQQLLEIKRRLDATGIQYYLLGQGANGEWDHLNTEMDTVVVMLNI